MSSFFKTFGKGILYVIFLPFILLLLAIYALLGVFVLITLFIKNIILFFRGKSIFTPLEEDVQADRILHKSKDIQQKMLSSQIENKQASVTTNTTTNNVYILTSDGNINKINPASLISNAPILDASNGIIDNDPQATNEIKQIESNNDFISLSRRDNVNNTKEDIRSEKEDKFLFQKPNDNKIKENSTFLKEPEPEEKDEIDVENEKEDKTKPNQNYSKIDLERDSFYKPKETIINKDDFISDEELEKEDNSFTFDSLKRDK